MNQYKELKDSFLLLKAQINALCASNSSSNEENYHELRRATDDFEAFLFHRFVDFEKYAIIFRMLSILQTKKAQRFTSMTCISS